MTLLGEGIAEGDPKKIFVGIGQVSSPIGGKLINELSKGRKEISIETTSEELIDLAIRSAEKAKAGAKKMVEGY